MTIRAYRPSDCATLAQLFYDTVHTVNAGDYSPRQLDAWATGQVDLQAWNQSFLEHDTLIAMDGGTIIGFGDMTGQGYLDRLYVHKDYQRKGIAAGICDLLEQSAPNAITTHASITAVPFFEKRGYQVVKEQQVERQGIMLTNFVMAKEKPTDRAKDNCSAFSSTEYDIQMQKTLPYCEDFYRQIIETVQAYHSGPLEWLDAGCGTGKMAQNVFETLEVKRFVFCDNSVQMLSKARQRCPYPQAEFLAADIRALPFREEFDAVTAVQVNHYFRPEDRWKAVQRCCDSLKPGGIFFTL